MPKKRPRSLPNPFFQLLFAFSLFSTLLPAQGLEYIKSHYTKYEFQVPMRDGVRLFTSVYAPKDNAQPYPMLMLRTPYSVGPYGPDDYRKALGPSEKFGKEGYIFIYQDVRGRYKSEGEFVNVRPYIPNKKSPQDIDESSDTYDAIDWLIKHVPNNNGRVGIWGISYPGFYAAMASIDAHPALKASSPQAPVADWFVGDDFHHNGALFLAHAFNYFSGFGRPKTEQAAIPQPPFEHGTPDGYKFFLNIGPLSNVEKRHFRGNIAFWNELMEHGVYDDFWKARNTRPHLNNIKPAIMTVGGWFDAEDVLGPLETYRSIEKSTPGAFNILVEGPWSHGQWGGPAESLGDIQFNSKTGDFFQENILFPFFEHFLKDKGEQKLPEAYVFETGTNQWRQYGSWPPKNAAPKTLYFQAGGRLSFNLPSADSASAFDEYVSDPARPVPFFTGITIGMTYPYMVGDQRFASRRTDVLVYQTDPLEEDFTVAGPIAPGLHVSTTGTDSDWIVKLIDVFPNDYPDPDPNPTHVHMGAYEQLIRGEPMRGKFRNSFEKPEPFEPGKVTKVEFVMPDVYHSFRRGHRIMVHVQSAWFPLVDLNPQTFVDIYHAQPSDFQKATQRVYRSAKFPSHLQIHSMSQ